MQFKLEKSLIEEETGEVRPMVLTDAIQVIECTWMRELDGADKDEAGGSSMDTNRRTMILMALRASLAPTSFCA